MLHYFQGASEAADKAAQLEEFKKARTVKINPDKPQEHARFLTLEVIIPLSIITGVPDPNIFHVHHHYFGCAKKISN